jgi:Spy/CpxP family protein refolding chaperone
MRELTLKARTDIEAILTPEQKAKLTVLLRYFGLLRAAGIPPRALPEVKLTPEQRSQIEALVKAAIEQLQPLKAEERRAKLREIIPDLRSKVSAVLTPEQKKAIAKYQRGGGARRNRQGGAAGAPA